MDLNQEIRDDELNVSQKVRSRAPGGDDAFFYDHQERMDGTPPLVLKP